MAAQSSVSFTAAVRQLITDALSDPELDVLCYDYLSPVYEKFGAGQSRDKKIQTLIEYCERQMIFPTLLAGAKQLNPARYTQFIAQHPDLAIGLPVSREELTAPIAQPDSDRETVLATSQVEDFEDFTFQNQKKIKTKILQNKANHIELYGPGGVGKTYLLQHLAMEEDQVRTVYIDLPTCSSKEQILAEAVRQLRDAQAAPASVSARDLTLSIRALHMPESGGKPFTHFIFLFDSATESHRSIIDWLVSSNGLISNRHFLESLRVQGVRMDEIKLQVVIAARRPIMKISSYHSNLRLERIRIDRLRKHLNPEEDPIQGMLQELADHKRFPIALAARQAISNKVYYLTGGHPKCAKLALFAVAARDFVPTADEWQQCFKTSILPVIRGEMLASVQDLRLLPVFQNLSVLRRFDQRLLAALLERQVLPGILDDEPDISRQARSLRKRLSDTYLVNEPDVDESMYTINYPVRRTLSLELQYETPRRFRAINSIALEIFAGWLRTAETTPDRAVLSLIELVYHWFKALELAQPPMPPADIITDLQQVLANYLPLLLNVIDPVDWSKYLSQLKAHWEADQELKETIELVTEDPACYQSLSRQFDDFIDRSIDNIADDIEES